jgi:predicted oxidoreductase
MKSVPLGVSSLRSSRLAYGCWRIGGQAEHPELTVEREAAGRAAIITAFENGFTLFDHADIYSDGAGEIIFGKALKEVPEMREQVIIASKCGIRKAGDPSPNSPQRYDFSREHIVSACERSLKRMGVERIDLYQLHRPDFLANPEEVATAFAELRLAGKVREFGVSNFRPSFLAMLRKFCAMPLIVNQVEINLLHLQAFSDGTLDQCITDKITPLAWSPLAAGRITYNGAIDLHEPHHAQRLKLRDVLDLIAREHNSTRMVVALAWLLKHPAGIIPIIGTTTPDRIKESARAVELELTREEWYRLYEAGSGHRVP